MRITKLKASGDGLTYTVFLDGHEIENVDYDFILCFGLEENEEPSFEAEAILLNYDEFRAALKRAYNILSFRDHGEKELVRKLVSKNISKQAAEYAALYMVKKGYINDGEYSKKLLDYYLSKGFGPSRIKQELIKKGISRDIIDNAVESIPEENGGAALKLLEKRYSRKDLEDPKIKNRAVGYLLRQGYGYDRIFSAINEYTEDFDETN